MEKLTLKNGTTIEIHPGASLGSITTDVGSYRKLEKLAKELTQENMQSIVFTSNDVEDESCIYFGMILTEPHFRVTQVDDHLEVTFGIREMTRDELKEPSIQTAIAYLTDEQALTVKNLYPEWDPDVTYNVGDRRLYGGVLYKCLQPHKAQSDWNPDAAPSLWAKILTDPAGEILQWEQPGSTNGYAQGDKVTHGGKTWESLVNNNVWEPGAPGTETVWKEIME